MEADDLDQLFSTLRQQAGEIDAQYNEKVSRILTVAPPFYPPLLWPIGATPFRAS